MPTIHQEDNKPVVVVIERAKGRAVLNAEDLRDAIAALPVDLRIFGVESIGTQVGVGRPTVSLSILH